MSDRQTDFSPLQFSVMARSNDRPDESFLVSGESLSKSEWRQALPEARFMERLFRGRVPFLMIWIDDFVPHLAHRVCQNVYNPHLKSWELIFEDEGARFIVLNNKAISLLPVNPHTEIITSEHLLNWHREFSFYFFVVTTDEEKAKQGSLTYACEINDEPYLEEVGTSV